MQNDTVYIKIALNEDQISQAHFHKSKFEKVLLGDGVPLDLSKSYWPTQKSWARPKTEKKVTVSPDKKTAETTFYLKNGKARKAVLKIMKNDSIYVETRETGNITRNRVFHKSYFKYVVFSTGDTLDLRLSHYPPVKPAAIKKELKAEAVIKQDTEVIQTENIEEIPPLSGFDSTMQVVIMLKNGDTLSGEIIQEKKNVLRMKTASGNIGIVKDNIQKIIFTKIAQRGTPGDSENREEDRILQEISEIVEQTEMISLKEGELQYEYIHILGVEGLEGQTAFHVSLKNDITPTFGFSAFNNYISEDIKEGDFLIGTAINTFALGVYYDIIDGLKRDMSGEIVKRQFNFRVALNYLRFDRTSGYLDVPEELASHPYAADLFKGVHFGLNGISGEAVVTMPIIQRIITEVSGSLGYLRDMKYYQANLDVQCIPLRNFQNIKIKLGLLLNSLGGNGENTTFNILFGISCGWGPFYKTLKSSAGKKK